MKGSGYSDMQQADGVQELSYDLWALVFSYLPFKDRLLAVPHVCSSWRGALRGPSLAWAKLQVGGADVWRGPLAWNLPAIRAWATAHGEAVRTADIELLGEAPYESAEGRAALLLMLVPALTDVLELTLHARHLPFPVVQERLAHLMQIQKLSINNAEAYDPSHFPVKPFPAGLTHLQLCFATDKATHFKSGPWEAPTLMPRLAPLTGMTCLVLANIAIFEIPEEVFQLTALQALCLRGCLVKQLPEAVTSLSNLETLSLRNNYHDKMDWGSRNWKYGGELIPTSLAQLGALQHLDISGIQVDRLPDGVEGLRNIVFLDLHNNFRRGELRLCNCPLEAMTSLRVLIIDPEMMLTFRRGLPTPPSSLEVLVISTCHWLLRDVIEAADTDPDELHQTQEALGYFEVLPRMSQRRDAHVERAGACWRTWLQASPRVQVLAVTDPPPPDWSPSSKWRSNVIDAEMLAAKLRIVLGHPVTPVTPVTGDFGALKQAIGSRCSWARNFSQRFPHIWQDD